MVSADVCRSSQSPRRCACGDFHAHCFVYGNPIVAYAPLVISSKMRWQILSLEVHNHRKRSCNVTARLTTCYRPKYYLNPRWRWLRPRDRRVASRRHPAVLSFALTLLSSRATLLSFALCQNPVLLHPGDEHGQVPPRYADRLLLSASVRHDYGRVCSFDITVTWCVV